MACPARIWLALLSPILCGCADSSDAMPSGHAGSYESPNPPATAETSPPSHRPSENAVPIYVDPAVELVWRHGDPPEILGQNGMPGTILTGP